MQTWPMTSPLMLLILCSSVSGRTEEVNQEITSSAVKEVDVQMEFGVGKFELSRPTEREDLVAAFVGEYDDRQIEHEIDFSEKGARGDLYFSVRSTRSHVGNLGSVHNEWELSLSPRLAFNLDIDIGAADVDFDFSELSIAELDLNVGATDAHLKFPTRNKTKMKLFRVDAGACDLKLRQLGNARFDELEFDGGMGSFLLDFSGAFDYEATAHVKVGMGSINIVLPRDIGVRLEADEHWFNSVDFPKRHFRRVRGEDSVYETEGFDSATGKLTIILEVGMGSAEVEFE